MTLAVGTDSFISVDGADSYMKTRLNSAKGWPITWDTEPLSPSYLPRIGDVIDGSVPPIDTLSPEYLRRIDLKERALRLATQILCSQSYKGCISSFAQVLAFPRIRITDREGRPIAADSIPGPILSATCELAYFLIENDVTDEGTRRSVFYTTQETVGQAMATYSSAASSPNGLPWVVRELIGPFLKSERGSAFMVQ